MEEERLENNQGWDSKYGWKRSSSRNQKSQTRDWGGEYGGLVWEFGKKRPRENEIDEDQGQVKSFWEWILIKRILNGGNAEKGNRIIFPIHSEGREKDNTESHM